MTIDSKAEIAETSIHEKMQSLAKQIWDEHGIAIQSVRFGWIDCSTPQQARLILATVDLESESTCTPN